MHVNRIVETFLNGKSCEHRNINKSNKKEMLRKLSMLNFANRLVPCKQWIREWHILFNYTENFAGEPVTTVAASDLDDPNTPNGTFKFTIASVTPKIDNVEFYIQQKNNTGSIYFKGCLDYEVNTIQCSASVLCFIAKIQCIYKMSTHPCFLNRPILSDLHPLFNVI